MVVVLILGMGSLAPGYEEKHARISDVLKSLGLPAGISYKFEISHEADNTERDFPGISENAKVLTTQPPDVVNFYGCCGVIGRAYFLREPIEVKSLSEMFDETEAILRPELGL